MNISDHASAAGETAETNEPVRRALRVSSQPPPQYDTWSLQDYMARNEAARNKFWERASSTTAKNMVRVILDLDVNHPTRRQALNRGWLEESEHVL